MYTYSKKSRRRMHAIPAAIALALVALLWLFTGASHTHAEQILSAQTISLWESDCRQCDVSSEYDVLQGDVVHLSSRNDVMISREIDNTPQAALLSWRWSVDPFVEGGTLLRVTLHIAETADWPARTLHYVWDNRLQTGTIETLSDFEHRIVVTGDEGKAESWFGINRDLNADWAALYNEPLPAIERIDVGLGMPGERAPAGAFISAITLQSQDSAQLPQPAVATDE